MSDSMLLVIIGVLALLAFAFGLWAGFGYPGLYDKYEKTGRASRAPPFEMLFDWIIRKLRR
ncbi:MAG: hypothetical protein ACE5HF_00530 [Gemmatimonadota bacterium]